MSLVAVAVAIAFQAPPDVEWAQRPQPECPQFACFISAAGDVQLVCQSTSDGRLEDCRVTHASPHGLGYEDAALASTSAARLRGVSAENAGGATRFTIRFRAADYADIIPKRRPYAGPEPSARAKEIAADIVIAMGADAPMDDAFQLLGGLDPERQRVVAPWVREAMPDLKQMAVAFFSRYLTEVELEGLLEGRFPDREPSITDLKYYLSDFMPDEDPALVVRARYCAAYECEITPPPETDTPAP
ncbi:MAG: hypothetical protein EON88_08870 [Brevundimonas sp.]|nr:MAG: hypothetical protein EON88_08870 [Brevundimonas sp.]